MQVNAVELSKDKGARVDRFNHTRRMVRHEFIQSLVRIAIHMFVSSGQESSVAAATGRLLDIIEQHAPPEALQDSNAFRQQHCYDEHTEAELRRHRETLYSLYKVYATLNKNDSDALQSQRTSTCARLEAAATREQLVRSPLDGARMPATSPAHRVWSTRLASPLQCPSGSGSTCASSSGCSRAASSPSLAPR